MEAVCQYFKLRTARKKNEAPKAPRTLSSSQSASNCSSGSASPWSATISRMATSDYEDRDEWCYRNPKHDELLAAALSTGYCPEGVHLEVHLRSFDDVYDTLAIGTPVTTRRESKVQKKQSQAKQREIGEEQSIASSRVPVSCQPSYSNLELRHLSVTTTPKWSYLEPSTEPGIREEHTSSASSQAASATPTAGVPVCDCHPMIRLPSRQASMYGTLAERMKLTPVSATPAYSTIPSAPTSSHASARAHWKLPKSPARRSRAPSVSFDADATPLSDEDIEAVIVALGKPQAEDFLWKEYTLSTRAWAAAVDEIKEADTEQQIRDAVTTAGRATQVMKHTMDQEIKSLAEEYMRHILITKEEKRQQEENEGFDAGEAEMVDCEAAPRHLVED